jgi:hypothetical protein
MPPQSVIVAAERWYEASREAGTSTAGYSALRRVLGWTLGEDAEFGIAYKVNVPVVVAIEGSRLLCVRPEDPTADNPEGPVVLDSIPLSAPLHIKMSIDQREYGQAAFLVKSWTIDETGASAFQVDTRTPMTRWQDGEYGGKAVLEKAAAALGWRLPDND